MSLYQLLKRFYRRNLNPEREHARDLARWFGPGKILDVGCGQGPFARLDPARIIGLDSSLANLRATHASGAICIQGVVNHLPFPSACFQGVYCSHVIEHLEPTLAYQLLLELDRVLASDGVLVLKSPMPHPRFYDEISHTRPYPPNVVLEVFWNFDETHHTFSPSRSRYEFLDLRWRYAPAFYPRLEPAFAPRRLWWSIIQKSFALLLDSLGIHARQVDGYTLVLRKAH